MKSNRLFLVSNGITESGIVANHWRIGVRACMVAAMASTTAMQVSRAFSFIYTFVLLTKITFFTKSSSIVDTHYRTYVGEFLEVVADNLDVVHIVYAEADGAVEDAVVGFDEDALHVYVELL